MRVPSYKDLIISKEALVLDINNPRLFNEDIELEFPAGSRILSASRVSPEVEDLLIRIWFIWSGESEQKWTYKIRICDAGVGVPDDYEYVDVIGNEFFVFRSRTPWET